MTDTTEPISRTPDEIIARIHELTADKSSDFFGVEKSRLLEALPFDLAQQFLEDDAPHTAETWESDTRIKDHAAIKAQILGYLPFAWTKANGSRGLSANRSMSHFKGLLWLLGPSQDELREWIGTPEHYEFYGKPALVKVSEFVGFDWPEEDNDEWR
ncbi:hypothetical protein LCGC14_3117920, partial [marine sediment metagenome]